MNFNFEQPLTFVFFFHENGHIESCSSFEDISALTAHKIHDPTLTVGSYAPTPEVRTSVILEWLKPRNEIVRIDIIFNDMTSLLNFIKI
jgi:hypothetical protein